MRFYHMGKQISPDEMTIDMLATQRLYVERDKDPGVNYPDHIKEDISKSREWLMTNLPKLQHDMDKGFYRLIIFSLLFLFLVAYGFYWLGSLLGFLS